MCLFILIVYVVVSGWVVIVVDGLNGDCFCIEFGVVLFVGFEVIDVVMVVLVLLW